MKTYVLSIEKGPRNPSLIEECLSLGLDIEVFQGIDGRQIDPEKLNEICDNFRARATYGRDLSPAEVGCALGHLGIVNRFLDSKQDWCLVLEDDVTLREELLSVLKFLKEIPPGTNIVNLRRQDIGPIYRPFRREIVGPFLRTSIPTWGASSYLLSREAATILSRIYEGRPVESVADWPILSIPKLRFWACSEMTVLIEDRMSYINSDREVFQARYARKSNLQKIWFKLRRVVRMLQADFPISSVYHWAVLPEILHLLGRRSWLDESTHKDVDGQSL